jgi:hypothetical protein
MRCLRLMDSNLSGNPSVAIVGIDDETHPEAKAALGEAVLPRHRL